MTPFGFGFFSLSLVLWRFMQVIAHVSRLFLCIARQESMVGEGNGNPLSILAWEITWTEEPGGFTVHRVAKDSDMT